MTASDERFLGEILIIYPLFFAIAALALFEFCAAIWRKKFNWRRVMMTLAIPVAIWKRQRRKAAVKRGWTPVEHWNNERLIARILNRNPVRPEDLMTSDDIVTKFIERKKAEKKGVDKNA